MAEHAERVGVHARLDARFARSLQRARQDLVAAATLGELGGEQILPAVARAHRRLEARGHARLAEPRHIAHLLGVCAELQVADADIGVQHIAGLDHPTAAAERHVGFAVDALPLPVDVGEEPDRQPERLESRTDVPGDILSRGHSRGDDPRAEGLGDHAAGDGDDLRIDGELGSRAGLEPTHHQRLGGHQSLRVRRRQHLA